MSNLTEMHKDWLSGKRADLKNAIALLGEEKVSLWDLPTFLAIIDEQGREIRRLRTQIHANSHGH